MLTHDHLTEFAGLHVVEFPSRRTADGPPPVPPEALADPASVAWRLRIDLSHPQKLDAVCERGEDREEGESWEEHFDLFVSPGMRARIRAAFPEAEVDLSDSASDVAIEEGHTYVAFHE
ncbi:hypothetical protein [Nocardiopsis sp. NRRL B-16309]|uniref:hypothetical protein n=1 Tax=Nocardiopsis sp. NRRL B-16309 TaxID=1519494 RepID=UPI0006AF113D|nr:hypothetical protein [Nocardiopsis sp. NRRL B-16309]KOX16002.1 hypothetical protein ADL05_13525 [Nocardiopsis sp. NRRL B-16309]